MIFKIRFYSLLTLLIMSGCTDDDTSKSSLDVCGENTLVVHVTDARIYSPCGCDEGEVTAVSGESFDCTTSLSSVVMFHNQSPSTTLQIAADPISEEFPTTIAMSPLETPPTGLNATAIAPSPDSVGDYPFTVLGAGSLAGTIHLR